VLWSLAAVAIASVCPSVEVLSEEVAPLPPLHFEARAEARGWVGKGTRRRPDGRVSTLRRMIGYATAEQLRAGVESLNFRNVRTRRLVAKHDVVRELVATAMASGVGDAADVRRMLRTQEAVGINGHGAALELAWAAHQQGLHSLSDRWLRRAVPSPATTWLTARKALSQGDYRSAGESFLASGGMRVDWSKWVEVEVAEAWMHGELAAIRTAEGRYDEALGLFLGAKAWRDAAWIAERVMTTEELTAWVERYAAAPGQHDGVRYLAARRLAREGSLHAAERWMPPEHLRGFRAWSAQVALGRGPRRDTVRGAALSTASDMVAEDGMPWVATALGADRWGDGCATAYVRTFDGPYSPSRDERRRVGRTGQDAPAHLVQAASLAWEAGSLLQGEDAAAAFCRGAKHAQGVDRSFALEQAAISASAGGAIARRAAAGGGLPTIDHCQVRPNGGCGRGAWSLWWALPFLWWPRRAQ